MSVQAILICPCYLKLLWITAQTKKQSFSRKAFVKKLAKAFVVIENDNYGDQRQGSHTQLHTAIAITGNGQLTTDNGQRLE
ncbi:MAG: hypothetical protein LC742_00630 [Acidobacteria bacterium]|nr:hypothetical protein [Acidobacteriota bacterium]